MALKRISLVRGNDTEINIVFKTASGVLYNIKNWVVIFTMKTNIDIPDSEASVQKIVTSFSDTTSGTSGLAVILLAHDDTINLPVGEYDFDIKITTAANQDYTVVRGKIDLEYDVTRTSGTAGTA